jgi:GGDEF domain-containing protein
VLLPNADLENATMLAENARAHRRRPDDMMVTVTIGVAVDPDEAHSAQTLLELVDERMYDGKRQGRNRVIAGSGTLV